VRSASALCVPHSLPVPRSRGKEKSCRVAAWTPIARGHYQKLAGSEWISISWWGAEVSLGGGFPASVVLLRRCRGTTWQVPTSDIGAGRGRRRRGPDPKARGAGAAPTGDTPARASKELETGRVGFAPRMGAHKN
jgi:hypothetical protein